MNSLLAADPSRKGLARRHPAFLIATWFGCGLLPKAPGTWGSAAALPLAWLIASWGGVPAMAAAVVAATLAGWWAADIYVRRTGRDDPGEVVVDEVAGQWLVLLAVPPDPVLYGAGFVVFRVLDIWKPWPACWADRRIGGGLGVMADDMLAAAYGCAIMTALVLSRSV